MDKQNLIDLVSEMRGLVEKLESELIGGDFKPATPPDEPEVKIPLETESDFRWINTLKVKDRNFNIKGSVKIEPAERSGTRQNGTEWNVADLLIGDGTGELRISFWGDNAEDAMDLEKGDVVLIEKIYKLEEWEGTLQANSGNYYKMVKLN